MKIYLESLGCSRNQVDSEMMLGRLIAAGHQSHNLTRFRLTPSS